MPMQILTTPKPHLNPKALEPWEPRRRASALRVRARLAEALARGRPQLQGLWAPAAAAPSSVHTSTDNNHLKGNSSRSSSGSIKQIVVVAVVAIVVAAAGVAVKKKKKK